MLIRPDFEGILQKIKIRNMKTNTVGIVAPINEKEMKESCNETKEIIGKKNGFNSTFAAVDLWRMQKKHKTLGSSVRW